MEIRVLLADDHQILRQGLRALLESQPDLAVVGEASEGRTAVETCRAKPVDVVVMDVRMPDLNGVDATRQLTSAGNGVKVIALSAQADQQTASAMLQAGAMGFVVKEAAFDELVRAIRTVVAGKVYLSPRVAGMVVDDYVRNAGNPTTGMFGTLTPREREVLQLIAEGKATKEVAAHLHVSVKTVETHRRSMMEKLHLDSVAELTKYAIREGITSL